MTYLSLLGDRSQLLAVGRVTADRSLVGLSGVVRKKIRTKFGRAERA